MEKKKVTVTVIVLVLVIVLLCGIYAAVQAHEKISSWCREALK